MDPFETERLKSLHLAYATFHTESQRHYPAGETAAHVLGGLGVIPKEGPVVQGVLGIERGLDKVLRGQDGSESVLMDVHHNGIDSRVDAVERPGTQLTLSIDSRMQYVAERELKAGVIAKHARSGTRHRDESLYRRNSGDGELSDLRSQQGPKQGDDPISRWNLGAQVPFEPGSMFKVITLTAALETTSLRPDSMIPTGNGILVLPGRVIHESHGGLGTISMADVLAKSSNIGAIMIGMKVGRENMYEYAHRFGFGQRSGVPLPAESPGILRPLNRWGTTSLASIAMGQEVSVTSIQIARAACVIANGGLLVKPRLVVKRGDKPEPMEAPVRIIKPETAILMRQMMEGVVLHGTGRMHARLNGYTSAGKTGTAQIYDPETHHYSHNYNASFVGFAPVTNPALVVLVTVHKTSGENGQGADAAAPVFSAIMTEALRMLDVPRDIPEQEIAAKARQKREDLRRRVDRRSGRVQHHGRGSQRAAVARRANADRSGGCRESGRNSAGSVAGFGDAWPCTAGCSGHARACRDGDIHRAGRAGSPPVALTVPRDRWCRTSAANRCVTPWKQHRKVALRSRWKEAVWPVPRCRCQARHSVRATKSGSFSPADYDDERGTGGQHN